MLYIAIKTFISACIIVLVSEIAKRNSVLGGIIASLPLVSLLAIIWLYQDTHDVTKVTSLTTSIFWLVIPSLIFFLVFPFLLQRGIHFYWAISIALIPMLLAYGLMLWILQKVGITLL